MPLAPQVRHWEGGSEVEARSQDIGLAVLVVIGIGRQRPSKRAASRSSQLLRQREG